MARNSAVHSGQLGPSKDGREPEHAYMTLPLRPLPRPPLGGVAAGAAVGAERALPGHSRGRVFGPYGHRKASRLSSDSASSARAEASPRKR